MKAQPRYQARGLPLRLKFNCPPFGTRVLLWVPIHLTDPAIIYRRYAGWYAVMAVTLIRASYSNPVGSQGILLSATEYGR